jgi:hypothetical protein
MLKKTEMDGSGSGFWPMIVFGISDFESLVSATIALAISCDGIKTVFRFLKH